jgi:hypothetical protein
MPAFFIPEALTPIITTPALPFATATTRGATDTQRAAAELARLATSLRELVARQELTRRIAKPCLCGRGAALLRPFRLLTRLYSFNGQRNALAHSYAHSGQRQLRARFL